MKKILCLLVVGSLIAALFACSDSKGPEPIPIQPGMVLTERFVEPELPCTVNVMLQAEMRNEPVSTDIPAGRFEIYEDHDLIDVTPRVQKRDDCNYRLRTILMLDRSGVSDEEFDQIKNAAISYIKHIDGQQEIALYTFSDRARGIVNFTDDVYRLIEAVETLTPAGDVRDLFGSYVYTVSRLSEYYSQNSVEQSCMVFVTNGNHTQGSYTLPYALQYLGDRRVYVVGIGDDIDVEQVRPLGSAGYYPVKYARRLSSTLLSIQENMVNWADNFYWLRYASPSRAPLIHALWVGVADNPNQDSTALAIGSFSSHGFYDYSPGVYVNVSPIDPYGIGTVVIHLDQTETLIAESRGAENTPVYEWEIDNDSLLLVTEGSDNSTARLTQIGAMSEHDTVTVRDIANGFEKSMLVYGDVVRTQGGWLDFPGNANAIHVDGNYAYIAAGYNGLHVIDIRLSTHPQLAATYSQVNYALDVFVQGDFAYICDGNYGFTIVDISDPHNPIRAGGTSLPNRGFGVHVLGDWAYVAVDSIGLQIVDVSNPSNPVPAGMFQTWRRGLGIYAEGNLAYVADSDAGVSAIDVSDPYQPTRAGYYAKDLTAAGVFVRSDTAFVAAYQRGLLIVDFTNPAAPDSVGAYNGMGLSQSVYVQDSTVCLANTIGGLDILDISDPSVPLLVRHYDTESQVTDVWIQGDYIYATHVYEGLQIIYYGED